MVRFLIQLKALHVFWCLMHLFSLESMLHIAWSNMLEKYSYVDLLGCNKYGNMYMLLFDLSISCLKRNVLSTWKSWFCLQGWKRDVDELFHEMCNYCCFGKRIVKLLYMLLFDLRVNGLKTHVFTTYVWSMGL